MTSQSARRSTGTWFQPLQGRYELLGQLQDGDPAEVDALALGQVEQQVERSVEAGQVELGGAVMVRLAIAIVRLNGEHQPRSVPAHAADRGAWSPVRR